MIDPYKHKERFQRWKERVKGGIPDLSKTNSDMILHYLSNMEEGLNVGKSSPKGSRSPIRLNTLKERIIFLIEIGWNNSKCWDIAYRIYMTKGLTEKIF